MRHDLIVNFEEGSILNSSCHALVNPVNCEGVMGAGLAKLFASRYPLMMKGYKEVCRLDKMKPGRLYIYNHSRDRIIINFPTKDRFARPSKEEYITRGMASLVKLSNDMKIKSIAIPALGCGLGGLQWPRVLTLMLMSIHLINVDLIEIYPPKTWKL